MRLRVLTVAVVLSIVPRAVSAAAQQSAGLAPATDSGSRSAMAGEVVHAETGAPIAGATVVLVNGGALGRDVPGEPAFIPASRSAQTDSAGRYRFEGLAAGQYTLRVHRLGFRPATIDVRMRGADSRLSVGLTVVPIKLQPMSVVTETPEPYARTASTALEQGEARKTALRHRQRIALSSDVREMTHADVTEAVTLGETDLFRALQRLPGVSTRNEFAAELWTRGGRWDQTRVLFDGLPVFNPVSGFGVFSSINADVLGGATLYPGVRPASLGEGSAAVLDLRTRPAGGPGDVRGVGELSVASARLTLDQRVANGRGGWLISGRRSYLDALLPLFAPDDPYGRFPYHFGELSGRFDWQLSADHSLEVSALHVADHVTGDTHDFIEGNLAHWGNSAARVTLSTPLGPMTARHTIGASRYDARMSVTPNAPNNALDGQPPQRPVLARVRHLTVGTEVAPATGPSGRWSAGAGFVLERAEAAGDVRAIYTGDVLSDEQTHWTTSLPRIELWGERRFEPTSALTVDLGARLDVGEGVQNGGVARLSPRGVARYALADATYLSAGVGRSFQYTQSIGPNGRTSENIAYPIPLWILAEDSRPALRSDIATLGIERWLGAAWHASANAYLRRSTGMLLPDPTPGAVTIHEIAVTGQELARGLEFGIRRVEGRATIAAGYSLGLATLTSRGLSYPSAQDRRHAVDLTAMVRPTRGFRVGFAFTAASGAPYTRSGGGSYGVDGGREVWIEPPWFDTPNAGRYRGSSSLDLLVDWTGTIRNVRVGTFVQVYNALGRDNPGTYAGAQYCSDFDATYNGCRPVDRFDAGLPRLPVIGFRISF